MENGVIELKREFKKVVELDHFDVAYTALLGLIALIGWLSKSAISIFILFLLGIIVLLLTNDLSFLIPNTIFSIFTINTRFSSDGIPLSLIICGSVYIFFLILQIILNGIHIKRMRSWIGLFGLALANMIPIFYAEIPDGRNIFYIFFFIDAIYFLIYLIFVNAIKRDSISLIAHTMSWLGVLIGIQCIITVISLSGSVDHIFNLSYNLGWNDNEAAGVIICMSIPFTYYILGKLSNTRDLVFNHLKVVLMYVGIILTSSKGAFIFGSLEAFTLVIALFHYSEHKFQYRCVTGVYLAIVTSVFMIMCIPVFYLFRDVNRYILAAGEPVDTISLWQLGLEEWTKNPLTIIFGSGFACVLRENTPGNVVPVVFHSAFIETLVVGGLFAVVFLLIHYIEKYRAVKMVDNKLFKITMLTGLIGVDMYSAIDNTYHMYYCMIPFVITMAVIDSTIYLDSLKEDVTI